MKVWIVRGESERQADAFRDGGYVAIDYAISAPNPIKDIFDFNEAQDLPLGLFKYLTVGQELAAQDSETGCG